MRIFKDFFQNKIESILSLSIALLLVIEYCFSGIYFPLAGSTYPLRSLFILFCFVLIIANFKGFSDDLQFLLKSGVFRALLFIGVYLFLRLPFWAETSFLEIIKYWLQPLLIFVVGYVSVRLITLKKITYLLTVLITVSIFIAVLQKIGVSWAWQLREFFESELNLQYISSSYTRPLGLSRYYVPLGYEIIIFLFFSMLYYHSSKTLHFLSITIMAIGLVICGVRSATLGVVLGLAFYPLFVKKGYFTLSYFIIVLLLTICAIGFFDDYRRKELKSSNQFIDISHEDVRVNNNKNKSPKIKKTSLSSKLTTPRLSKVNESAKSPLIDVRHEDMRVNNNNNNKSPKIKKTSLSSKLTTPRLLKVNDSAKSRLPLLLCHSANIFSNPWGQGVSGQYLADAKDRCELVFNKFGMSKSYAGQAVHNSFLLTTAYFGFPVLLFVVYVFFNLLYKSWQVRNYSSNLFPCVSMTLIAYFVHSFFHNRGPMTTGYLFWFWAGVVLSLCKEAHIKATFVTGETNEAR